jgi:hypothetical protein
MSDAGILLGLIEPSIAMAAEGFAAIAIDGLL